MSFASDLSRNQAKATVDKLFASIIPELGHKKDAPSKKKVKLSATELLAQQFHHNSDRDEVQQELKRKRRQTAAKIKKTRENDKKFSKHVKYNIIKNHKAHTEEEKKYLAKLQKKNVNQLLKLGAIEDMEVADEVEDLLAALADEDKIVHKKHKRSKEGRGFEENLKASEEEINRRHKLDAFNKRVEDGVLAVPSLTPGLAPVGYDDESEEEEE